MWQAWSSLKTYHLKPSEVLEVEDSIAAYCLDKCVLWFGITVENLLSEREETGDGKERHSEAKYELEELLDKDFRVPREPPKPKKAHAAKGMDGIAMMLALAKQPGSGVRLWKPIEPV